MRFFNDISNGLGRIVDAMSENSKRSRDERILKEAILDRLSIDEIKLLFRLAGIVEPAGQRYDPRTGMTKKCRLVKKDYATHAANSMDLGTIKKFASRHAKIHDLLIEERHMEAERGMWRNHPGKMRAVMNGSGRHAQIIEAIGRFRPSRAYRDESFYQVELAGFLKHQFPDTAIEVQAGSARPDIVIGDTAIEIKGPTTYRDLATIFDKCVRYTRGWNHLIVALFMVEVSEGQYAEWERSLKKHFPDVILIKK
jgi:hypothetical protein